MVVLQRDGVTQKSLPVLSDHSWPAGSVEDQGMAEPSKTRGHLATAATPAETQKTVAGLAAGLAKLTVPRLKLAQKGEETGSLPVVRHLSFNSPSQIAALVLLQSHPGISKPAATPQRPSRVASPHPTQSSQATGHVHLAAWQGQLTWHRPNKIMQGHQHHPMTF